MARGCLCVKLAKKDAAQGAQHIRAASTPGSPELRAPEGEQSSEGLAED